MLPNVEHLTRLHQQALSVLACVREVQSEARAFSIVAKKKPSKATIKRLTEAWDRWRSAFREYHKTVDSNRMIKLWFFLLDMWHLACQSHDRPGPTIGWDGINEIDAMHCHDALNLTASKISYALARIGTNEPSLEGLPSLAVLPMIDVVCRSEFETGLIEEFQFGCQTLEAQHDYGVPLGAHMGHSARLKNLRRVNDRTCVCENRVHELRERYGRRPLFSTDSWAAGHQARQQYDQVIREILELESVEGEISSSLDCDDAFDIIKRANIDHLAPIEFAGKSFATAHETVLAIANKISSLVWGTEGGTDKEWNFNLAKRLRRQSIPSLTAQLEIEKVRAEKWLEQWFEGELERERQERLLDELPDDEEDEPTSSRTVKKRGKGRPSKRECAETALLEKRFAAARKKVGHAAACREVGISVKEGNKIQRRLAARLRRAQEKEFQRRKH